MQRPGPWLSRIALMTLTVLGLSGCGGGGGGGDGLSLRLNTSRIAFTSAAYQLDAPATQTITGTLSGSTSGTVYILIEVAGSGYTVSDVSIAGDTGSIQVIPTAPPTLGVGRYTGTITVTACLNDPTCQSRRIRGTPATVEVEYEILSTVKSATVSPYVVPTAGGETVILRHPNLAGVESVTIGGTPATYEIVSTTELRVGTPALAAGEHTILVDVGVAALPFRLVAVAPLGAPTQTLAWPFGGPVHLIDTSLYDAERRALLVLAWNEGPAVTSLIRYAWNGSSWSAPTMSPVNDIRDIALSPDGSRILAITYNNVVELDPVSLTTIRSSLIPPTTGGYWYDEFHQLAIANDNLAVITSRVINGIHSRMYIYQIGEPGVQRFIETYAGTNAYASPDGSFVIGGAYLFPGPYRYEASSGIFRTGPPVYSGFPSTKPSLDTHATRMLAGPGLQAIDGALLGTLPNTLSTGMLTRDGQRIYTYDYGSGDFQVYDASAPNGGALPAMGAPLQLTPGNIIYSTSDMAMTPAGDVAFVVEARGIHVVPINASAAAGYVMYRRL